MGMLETITMQIDRPSHQQSFVAMGAVSGVDVSLQGTILSTNHEPSPLFFKWYSSLDGELGITAILTATLAVGSHIVTFMAKDKSDEGVAPENLAALYKSVQHIGAAGGPPEPPPPAEDPCVIHVFIANMLAPDSDTLSKSNPDLEAQSSLQWANYVEHPAPEPAEYVGLNPQYHAVNKIRYRWFFRHVDDPPGLGTELDLEGGDALQLVPPDDDVEFPRLRYTGDLPHSLIRGERYTVTLRVENKDDDTEGHQISRTVTIQD